MYRPCTEAVRHRPLLHPHNNNNQHDTDRGEHQKEVEVLPLTVPIYASSTFILQSALHGATLSQRGPCEDDSSAQELIAAPYLYSRWENPTSDAAAEAINKLEDGYKTFLVSPSACFFFWSDIM